MLPGQLAALGRRPGGGRCAMHMPCSASHSAKYSVKAARDLRRRRGSEEDSTACLCLAELRQDQFFPPSVACNMVYSMIMALVLLADAESGTTIDPRQRSQSRAPWRRDERPQAPLAQAPLGARTSGTEPRKSRECSCSADHAITARRQETMRP